MLFILFFNVYLNNILHQITLWRIYHQSSFIDVESDSYMFQDRQKITIRRRHIWEDTKRALRRLSFNPCIGLDICFIGEDAQDVEYFTLLWPAIARDTSIFSGPKESRSLTHNMLSLKNDDYTIVGKCVSLALVYGGSVPHFFSHMERY